MTLLDSRALERSLSLKTLGIPLDGLGTMDTSNGSSRSVPTLPFGGPHVGRARCNSGELLAQLSTNPPPPLSAPPRARIVPAKVVWLSDQSTTLPPWPRPVADALIVSSRRRSRGRGRDDEGFELGATNS